jgi:hypothetical protein
VAGAESLPAGAAENAAAMRSFAAISPLVRRHSAFSLLRHEGIRVEIEGSAVQ